MDYRFKHNVSVISFPQGEEEEDRGYGGCCCVFKVLASLTDPDPAINDVSGFYVKKADAGDVVTFQMTKVSTGVVITNYGTVGVFPNETLGVGFIYDWRQVLDVYGVGRYRVDISYTIAGVTDTAFKGCFELDNYSIEKASGTVMIRSKFRSYFLLDDFDFTGSNFEDSIRFGGLFGHRLPGTQIRQLIDTGGNSIKPTRENLNTYSLLTDPVLQCVSKRLLDFFFLNEDETSITDHNQHNHVYYFAKSVVPDGEPDVEYHDFSRLASFSMPYSDKKKLSKSMYNG